MKCKSLLTAWIIGLSTLPLSARQLSPGEALSRITPAEMNRIKAATPHAQLQLKSTGYDADGKPAYYIFAGGERTLFASADDVAAPLLGYVISPDFNVDDMPPAMSWWLSEYARQIAWATANDIKPYAASRSADDKAPIAPLIKTTWNQDAPYNDLCPQVKGEHAYTGCVATSTAQVMNYHQWPPHGTGAVSYELDGETLSMDLGATTFAWDDMLDSYPTATTGTEAQRQAVATLMKACGYALHMEYKEGASAAYPYDIPAVLVDHFGYDAALHYECPDYYSPQQWEQMIYDNLANIGPLVYGGRGIGGGHSFVCDGYDRDGLFHINWGWGGTSDGYFLLSVLDPSSLGAGGGAGGYNTTQSAILGIQKPQHGSVKPLPFIGCRNISHLYGRFDSPFIEILGAHTGNSVNSSFVNAGSHTGFFSIGVRVVKEGSDDEGMILPRFFNPATDIGPNIAPGHGHHKIAIEIPQNITDGVYKAYPVYKLEDNQWENVRVPYGVADHIGFSIKDGLIYFDKNSVEKMYIESLEFPTGLIAGEPYTINLTVTNISDQTIDCYLQAVLYQPHPKVFVDFLEGASATLNPNETTHMLISGTLSHTITEGEYDMAIEWGASDIYVSRVTVTDSSSRNETTEDASEANATQWFDLSGRAVEPASLSQGIYIKTDGVHTEKVVVK